MKLSDIPQLRDAPLASKLELVDELWADIAASADSADLPEWHVGEIEQSLRDYESQPREGKPWPDIRDQLLRKK